MIYDPAEDFEPVLTLQDLERIVNGCKANPELPVYMVRELVAQVCDNAS